MKKKLYLAGGVFTAFILWTVAVSTVDVKPIGPNGSAVGLAAFNRWMHEWIGVHLNWYYLTDLLSLIPLGIIAGFALLGMLQWIKRKHLLKVDRSILALGGFYAAVMVAYLLFEVIALNYRPVLIEGILEASYPSSTTVLMICVMYTAALQFKERIKTPLLKKIILAVITGFTLLCVIGRILSGVHWISDIIGGILLSIGLVKLYVIFCGQKN